MASPRRSMWLRKILRDSGATSAMMWLHQGIRRKIVPSTNNALCHGQLSAVWRLHLELNLPHQSSTIPKEIPRKQTKMWLLVRDRFSVYCPSRFVVTWTPLTRDVCMVRHSTSAVDALRLSPKHTKKTNKVSYLKYATSLTTWKTWLESRRWTKQSTTMTLNRLEATLTSD